MRTFRHWTLVYIWNRIKEFVYRQRNPLAPWLTPAAIQFLQVRLRQSDVGLEFGSGRSTLWLALHVAYLTSVEHNSQWRQKVLSLLDSHKIKNVTYLFFEMKNEENDGEGEAYVEVCQTFTPSSLDFILIDGVYRSDCSLRAISLLKPGGFLILDNANWFLPSATVSPTSRSFQQGPLTSKWKEFYMNVQSWDCLWTSNGITDTAIYTKPNI